MFPTTIESVAVEELRQMLSKANYLLVQCYLGGKRQGWEKGKTESEIYDEVCAFLWNQELQPNFPAHEANVKELIAIHEGVKKLPSFAELQQKLESRYPHKEMNENDGDWRDKAYRGEDW